MATVFNATIRVVQFEHDRVSAWHIWCKKTVTGFDPGEVHISIDRFAHRIRGQQLSAERNGNKRLRFVREILK